MVLCMVLGVKSFFGECRFENECSETGLSGKFPVSNN